MDFVKELVSQLNSLVWGPYMLVLILGTGFILMLGLRLMPILRLGYGFSQLWRGRKSTEEGDITPFNALMTFDFFFTDIQQTNTRFRIVIYRLS